MQSDQRTGGFARRSRHARLCATAMMAMLAAVPVGCRTTRGAATEGGQGWECLAFRPISWSSRDTERTSREVREHNAVWDALCAAGTDIRQ